MNGSGIAGQASDRRRVAYYITPHGFGHAVRSLEVIRCLLQMEEGIEVIVVSDLPEFLVEQNVGRSLPVRRKRLDVGLVQNDSIRFDLAASLEAVQALYVQREALVAEEVLFLKSQRVDTVVSDIPFLALAAASRCGIPGTGISNFSWDWIYEAYARSDPRWNPLVAWIRECYRGCDLFLQLPMHGDCSVFPRRRDVPLVARKARRARTETRQILGLEPGQKVYLIAFAALDLDDEAQRCLENMERTVFLYKRPLRFSFSNARSVDGAECLSYADVVAAVDGVITKPGYGIVSDCLVHGTPVIYTDRGFFPEYEKLVEEMTRQLTTVFMPSEDLYAGRWESAIHRLESLPRRSARIRHDGASVCANAIVQQMSRAG